MVNSMLLCDYRYAKSVNLFLQFLKKKFDKKITGGNDDIGIFIL